MATFFLRRSHVQLPTRILVLGVAVAASLCGLARVAEAAAPPPPPGSVCMAEKMSAVQKGVQSLLRCQANEVSRGRTSPGCAAKASAKLQELLDKAEQKNAGQCLATGNNSAVVSIVDEFVAQARAIVAADANVPAKCPAKKLIAAARYARANLIAAGNGARKPSAEKLGRSFLKASDSITKDVSAADRQGDCTGGADLKSIAVLADSFVTRIVSVLEPCTDVSEQIFRRAASGVWKETLAHADSLGFIVSNTEICPIVDPDQQPARAYATLQRSGDDSHYALLAFPRHDMAAIIKTAGDGTVSWFGPGGGLQLEPRAYVNAEGIREDNPSPVNEAAMELAEVSALNICPATQFCAQQQHEFLNCVKEKLKQAAACPAACLAVSAGGLGAFTCGACIVGDLFGIGTSQYGACKPATAFTCPPCEPSECHIGGDCTRFGTCKPFPKDYVGQPVGGARYSKEGELPRCDATGTGRVFGQCDKGYCRDFDNEDPCNIEDPEEGGDQCVGPPGAATCVSEPKCGDGVVNGDEECDCEPGAETVFGTCRTADSLFAEGQSQSCQERGYDAGVVNCHSDTCKVEVDCSNHFAGTMTFEGGGVADIQCRCSFALYCLYPCGYTTQFTANVVGDVFPDPSSFFGAFGSVRITEVTSVTGSGGPVANPPPRDPECGCYAGLGPYADLDGSPTNLSDGASFSFAINGSSISNHGSISTGIFPSISGSISPTTINVGPVTYQYEQIATETNPWGVLESAVGSGTLSRVTTSGATQQTK